MSAPTCGIALGRTLGQIRVRCGLSQAQLAQRAGVRREDIGALERGEALLDEPRLARLGEALGIGALGIGALGVGVLAEHLHARRRNREKLARLLARNPGIGTMLAGLDDTVVYSRAAVALLAGAVAAMEHAMAAVRAENDGAG